MENLKFFSKFFMIGGLIMIFVFLPLIYFNSKDIEENLHVTTGEIISKRKDYARTGHSNRDNVGILEIKFYNKIQDKEMQSWAILIDHEELKDFSIGQKIEIGYTEGRDFLSATDNGLFLMDRYESHDKIPIIPIASIGFGLILFGFILRLLYFKFKKD